MNDTTIARECLIIAADLLDGRSDTDYLSKLNSYTENFSLQHSFLVKPEKFDNMLYNLAKLVWPKALNEICDRTNTNLI